MSFVRSRPLALLVALTFSIAACGGDDDEPSGPSNSGNLTSAEVADALSALSAIGFIGGAFGGQVDLPAGLSLQSGSQSFDQSEACPRGGNMRLQGSINYSQTGSFSVDLRQTHNNCQAPSESGRVWTFNGSPNLRIQLTSNAAAASFNGSITGGFRYSSNGSTGSCSADLTLNFNAAGTGTARGTMCGVSVDESY
jgi:hypothetical protein